MDISRYERSFVLDPELSVYLPFWKRDGDTVISESRYGQACDFVGAIWTPQGRYFNGINSSLKIPASPETALSNGHTVLMWVKVVVGEGYKSFWRKQISADFTMGMFTEPSYSKLTIWFKNVPEDSVYGYLKTAPSEGEWMLLGHTSNNEGTSTKGFFNGKEVWDDTTYVLPNLLNTDTYVGCTGGASAFIDALIHSFFLWNRVLDPFEVDRFYNISKSVFGLVEV